jgi:hypothetical protein
MVPPHIFPMPCCSICRPMFREDVLTPNELFDDGKTLVKLREIHREMNSTLKSSISIHTNDETEARLIRSYFKTKYVSRIQLYSKDSSPPKIAYRFTIENAHFPPETSPTYLQKSPADETDLLANRINNLQKKLAQANAFLRRLYQE